MIVWKHLKRRKRKVVERKDLLSWRRKGKKEEEENSKRRVFFCVCVCEKEVCEIQIQLINSLRTIFLSVIVLITLIISFNFTETNGTNKRNEQAFQKKKESEKLELINDITTN